MWPGNCVRSDRATTVVATDLNRRHDPMPSSPAFHHPLPLIGLQAALRPIVRARLRSTRGDSATGQLARALAWQWVASKWPRLLPSAAAMASDHFTRSSPGQQLVAATHPDGSGWTLSVAFHERQGARTWITHADVRQTSGVHTLHLHTDCTAIVDAPLVVAPPRLLGSWVERLQLVDGPVAVLGEARPVGNPEQLAQFLAHVRSPDRRLPIIALANRPDTRFFGVDPAGLATAVRGLAHVACLAPDVADEVAVQLGSRLGVVPGAARIYGAGHAITASPQYHPLIRNHHASDNSAARAGMFRRVLCQRICALSVRDRSERPGSVCLRQAQAQRDL